MSKRIDPARTRQIFSQNLRELSKAAGNISEVSRATGINRTQFNRYLNGEAFPRPDVLARICGLFDTDARILTEPLATIKKTNPVNIDPRHNILHNLMQRPPLEQSRFPDGLYIEWAFIAAFPGLISRLAARVWTDEAGQRRMRIKAPDPVTSVHTGRHHSLPQQRFNFFLFPQRNGFASIDGGQTTESIAFTAFKCGYLFHSHLYPGYKLAGTSYENERVHSHWPCVLERPNIGAEGVLPHLRVPCVMPIEDAPTLISEVLKVLATEAITTGWQEYLNIGS